MSGHFFFRERWYGFDDGIYAAARLLEILAHRTTIPRTVFEALPKGVSTPEIKIEAPRGEQYAFVERVQASAAKFEGARLSTIDGVRADWPDGWGLVRASNTTPVLVLRFDADSREAMARDPGRPSASSCSRSTRRSSCRSDGRVRVMRRRPRAGVVVFGAMPHVRMRPGPTGPCSEPGSLTPHRPRRLVALPRTGPRHVPTPIAFACAGTAARPAAGRGCGMAGSRGIAAGADAGA